ncbi:MAG: Holliday junction branch migration protein RuvA [Dehalococcoidia bacterium]|nr:Holliday junction branch migration protein RuvA [Dehalococcoidia bacterium]
MIAALRGVVTHYDPDTATAWVDVQGVVYEVRIPAFVGEWVGSVEGVPDTTLYTYYHVSERQPAPLLIGFQYLQEREFFRKFIEVPDVGPTKAVRALTRPVSEIARWIEAGDVKALRQLPGIGQRLSQTIVAQLSGKLTQEALLRGEATPTAAVAPTEDLRADAVDALVALQYSRRDAERSVERALEARPGMATLEDLLRAVLEGEAPSEGRA